MPGPAWVDEELDVVRRTDLSDAEAAEILGRTLAAVSNKRSRVWEKPPQPVPRRISRTVADGTEEDDVRVLHWSPEGAVAWSCVQCRASFRRPAADQSWQAA